MPSSKKPYNNLPPDRNDISLNSLPIALSTSRNESSLVSDLSPLSLPIVASPLPRHPLTVTV